MKQVAVLIGAGSIGQAIVRRVAVGKHVVLADYSEQNAATAAKTLEDAGFECSTLRVDLGSKEDILTLVREAQKYGEVTTPPRSLLKDNVAVILLRETHHGRKAIGQDTYRNLHGLFIIASTNGAISEVTE